jgi:cytochrome bd-type quinol oxidase subunit 2
MTRWGTGFKRAVTLPAPDSDSHPVPPSTPDRPRTFPWFSWISAICLLCFPFCVLGAPITSYYKGPLAKLTRQVMFAGAFLSPFAALFAAWLAMKRGERNEEKCRGCLVLAVSACAVVVLIAVAALVNFLRGSP